MYQTKYVTKPEKDMSTGMLHLVKSMLMYGRRLVAKQYSSYYPLIGYWDHRLSENNLSIEDICITYFRKLATVGRFILNSYSQTMKGYLVNVTNVFDDGSVPYR